MRKLLLALASITIAFGTSKVFSQDNHRATNQFGTRSALMGGAVVGGVNDSSATFYNPGALAFIRDTSISVSANALRLETLERDNILADGIGFDSEEFNVVPLMVSGVFIPEDISDLVIGYSFQTKNSTKFSDTVRREGTGDFISGLGFEGDEELIAQASTNADLQEYWGGLAFSYPLDNHLAVGFTNFLALRQQEAQDSTVIRSVNENTLGVSVLDTSSSVDYYNLRALWKFGLTGHYDGVRFGLTVTTPSVDLTGDATSSRDLTASNVDLTDDGVLDGLVANDRQDDLDAEYKTPFSIAGGVEIDLQESTRLAGSAEWYGAVGSYNVVDPESRDFLRPVGVFGDLFDSRDFLQVVDSADAIVNFAVALEQDLASKWKGYLAFRSDFETSKRYEGEGRALGFSTWDIWHTTVGVSYEQERSTFSLGFEYSFGDSNDPAVDTLEVDNSYNAYNVLFGYTYHFGDIVHKG